MDKKHVKGLLTAFVLCAIPAMSQGITLVAHTGAAGTATSATSAAINTTGASLLVVVAMADGGSFGG